MKSHVLPILNVIGCLVLTGLVISQWRQERVHMQENLQLKSELGEVRILLAAETQRAAILERDIDALKESIELSRQSAAESEKTLAEQNDQLTAARDAVKTWEAAIDVRDAKLRELDGELQATHARLDEAVTKLKAASAK